MQMRPLRNISANHVNLIAVSNSIITFLTIGLTCDPCDSDISPLGGTFTGAVSIEGSAAVGLAITVVPTGCDDNVLGGSGGSGGCGDGDGAVLGFGAMAIVMTTQLIFQCHITHTLQ